MLPLALVSALATGALWVQAPRVEELIRALGDDRLPERDRAESALRKLGTAAEQALRAASSGEDAEIRTRVARLIEILDWNRTPPLAVRLNLKSPSLVLLGAPGTEPKTLVWEEDAGEMRGRPIWAPDASSLVFVTFNGLHLVSRGGDRLEKLLEQRISPEFLSWSPDGKFLLFPSEDPVEEGGTACQIHLLELSSRKLRVISRGKQSESPCWSPDSKRVAYLEYTPGEDRSTKDLILVELAGGAATKLTQDGLEKGLPAWCPDGSCIAYVGQLPNRELPGLLVIDLKTGAVRMLSEDWQVAFPIWSPDGKRIAYLKGRPGDLYVIDRSGGNEVRLSKDADLRDPPTWSPDGRRVAFSANLDGVWQVYSDGVDGKDPRRHTSEKEGAADPSWAPFR
jgi:Tol biopolymer transport system component